MKPYLIIILACVILLAGISSLSAQNIKASTYMEKTHMNPKLGTSVGYEFKNKGEIGGFYQQIAEKPATENGYTPITEEEFYGMYMAYPFFTTRTTNIKFNVRTGVSNGENFVITPSVLANFNPIPVLAIGGGIGTRALRPTLMATISLKLGNSNQKNLLLAQK